MTRWRWRCHVISTFIEQNSRMWPWTHHSEAAPQSAAVRLCAATWWSNISLFLADLQSRWQVSEGTTTVDPLCWSVLRRPSWEFSPQTEQHGGVMMLQWSSAAAHWCWLSLSACWLLITSCPAAALTFVLTDADVQLHQMFPATWLDALFKAENSGLNIVHKIKKLVN